MDRRQFLSLSGLAILPSLSGCLAGDTDQNSNNTSEEGGAPSQDCLETGSVTFTSPVDTFTPEEPHDGIGIQLINDTECTVLLNTINWDLFQHTTTGWELVDQNRYEGQSNQRRLSPGDRHTFIFALRGHPTPYNPESSHVFTSVRDGTYRLSVSVTPVSEDTTITRDAEFELRRQFQPEDE